MKLGNELPQIYRCLTKNRRALKVWQGLSPTEKERLCARAARISDPKKLELLMLSLDDSEWGAEYF